MLFIKAWVSNICAALIFITAVEILLPDNNFKKYCKLILGLILMIVVINPMISLLNKDINLQKNIDKYMSISTDMYNIEDYREKNIHITERKFEENIKLSLKELLKDEFKDSDFKIEVLSFYNEQEKVFDIKEINIGYISSSTGKIKKININDKWERASNFNNDTDLQGEKIKNSIWKKTSIPVEKIKVYKI
ncbi:stage III sporulation protein AF [Clostridium polynesiense]|uniref:stage III sporulation protein AF n=1 Tax=Clostridium polynesiense TaxID=1325933 RepID=UPI0005916A4A|nr:stage III sporulation protein AF [Clostridium polynesiense]